MIKITSRDRAKTLCAVAGVFILFASGAHAEDAVMSTQDEINAALERAERKMKEQDEINKLIGNKEQF